MGVCEVGVGGPRFSKAKTLGHEAKLGSDISRV
jgi:hypothetical protein